MKGQVAADIRAIFNDQDRAEAEALLMETRDDWQAGKAYLTFSQQ